MAKKKSDTTRAAAERAVEMAEEVESSGHASVKGSELESARAALHQWIDNMTGVVVAPGLGRVTVIHPNGRVSTISSPDLPFAMSKPIEHSVRRKSTRK
jgi:hypothetical protein